MSKPGDLTACISQGSFIIKVYTPINQNSKYPIFVFKDSQFLFGGSVDYERYNKLLLGDWEIESDYCPTMQDDIFYLKWY